MDAFREPVFVYGTLRRGASNHFRMDGSVFLAAGTIAGRMYRFGWYPGLVVDATGSDVFGEVYAVGHDHLAALDEFEGVSAHEVEGSEYRRVRVTVHTAGGPILAWVWEWVGKVDESTRIPHGDWLKGTEI
jgi:gamma-glutamylcyclotransferase (GGCT)/AIG2-like uncharacterized protein YtfP